MPTKDLFFLRPRYLHLQRGLLILDFGFWI